MVVSLLSVQRFPKSGAQYEGSRAPEVSDLTRIRPPPRGNADSPPSTEYDPYIYVPIDPMILESLFPPVRLPPGCTKVYRYELPH